MAYLEELLPEFRNGAKIRQSYRGKNYFIQLKDGQILDSYGSLYKFTSIDLLEDKWEFYQEPIDWEYIIKNKCLCLFWDDCFEAANIGLLGDVYKECELKYVLIDEDGNRGKYLNCRPVRKDEVTFYDERDDES